MATSETPAAPASDNTLLGLPKPLVWGALAAGALWAYFSSGAADAAASSAGDGTAAGTGTSAGTGTTHSTPGGNTPAPAGTTKPKRRAIVGRVWPLLYVFVDSVGGEGIFDRLKNSATWADGNGLNRIVTLGNHEFAGWATGRTWTAPDTRNVYLELYQEINKQGYNYWIQQKETVAVHSQAATQGYGSWGPFIHMTDGVQNAIAQFYFVNYQA